MPRDFRPIAAVTLVLLLGCCGCVDVQHLYGGRDRYSLIETAESIDAFRVESPLHTSRASTTAPTIAGMHIIGAPVVVDQSTARQLSTILRDPATYERLNKACMLNPDVAVRFSRGNDCVIVVFCFTCNQLEIVDGVTAQRLGFADDDAKREQLLAIMKRLFPDDAKLRRLKEQEN